MIVSYFSYWIYHVKCIFNRIRDNRVMVFNITFSNISFISWRRNRSTQRKPLTCRKSLTNFITYVVSSKHRLNGFELTLVVMGTDCIGSYKSNYHTITTSPIFNNTIFSLRVIFFLYGGCDILVLIFSFWTANLKRLFIVLCYIFILVYN